MTPLALAILNQLALPPKKRSIVDPDGNASRLGDIHCFDMTEGVPLADELVSKMKHRGYALDEYAFLPFPKTWIEWRIEGERSAVLLEDGRNGCHATFFAKDCAGLIVSKRSLVSIAAPCGMQDLTPFVGRRNQFAEETEVIDIILAFLAMINTPKVIGSTPHAPHKGLERKLAASKFSVGMFPLNTWTTVHLKVTDPRCADEADPNRRAIYTGERALHWVRAHLRIRLGRVEFVSAHKRGNENLGVRQTRYRVAA